METINTSHGTDNHLKKIVLCHENDPIPFMEIESIDNKTMCIKYKSGRWQSLQPALLSAFKSACETYGPTSILIMNVINPLQTMAIVTLAQDCGLGVITSPDLYKDKSIGKELLSYLDWFEKQKAIRNGQVIQLIDLSTPPKPKYIDLRRNKTNSSRKFIVKLGKLNATFGESNTEKNIISVPENKAHLYFLFNKVELEKKEEYILAALKGLDTSGLYSIKVTATYIPLLKPMLSAIIQHKHINKNLNVSLSQETINALEKNDPKLLNRFNQDSSNIEASNLRYNAFNVMGLMSKNVNFSEIELKVYLYLFGMCLNGVIKKSASYLIFSHNLIYNAVDIKNAFPKNEVYKAVDSLIKKRIIVIQKHKGSKYFYINEKGPFLI